MLESSKDDPSIPTPTRFPPGPTSVSTVETGPFSKSEPVVSGWQEATGLLQSQPIQDGSDLLCCPRDDGARCTHLLEEGGGPPPHPYCLAPLKVSTMLCCARLHRGPGGQPLSFAGPLFPSSIKERHVIRLLPKPLASSGILWSLPWRREGHRVESPFSLPQGRGLAG